MAEEKQADFFEYAFYRDAMTGEVLPDLPESTVHYCGPYFTVGEVGFECNLPEDQKNKIGFSPKPPFLRIK